MAQKGAVFNQTPHPDHANATDPKAINAESVKTRRIMAPLLSLSM
jgi:hypothetical protein